MAVCLFFRRIVGPDSTDHDTRVTYEYGPDPDDTPHRLVIDMVAETVRAGDGTWGDPTLSTVAGKVLSLRRDSGRWPATGNRFS